MSLIIDCDRLFDGEEIHEGARIIVEGERIAAVEKAATDAPAADGERLRCPFAMPGLIDSHLHISGYVEGSPAGAPYKPVKAFLRLLILNGVTTARDTGNSIETIKYVREWGERYQGPRVFGSGPLLDVPPLMWPFSRIVRDPESARREVELLHLEGMDFIKSYRNVTPEVLAAIVEAAGERGMDVAADVKAATALEACRLGVRSLEHAMNLFDERSFPEPEGDFTGAQGRARLWSHLDLGSSRVEELVSELLAHGTFVCPTLLVSHRWADLDAMINEPYLDYMVAVMPYHQYFKRMRGRIGRAIGGKFMAKYMPVPKPSRAEKVEIDAGLAKMRAMTRHLHEAGVPLVLGTDSPNPSVVPGFSVHQEMALWVEAGLPPIAVLTAATSRAAALLRRDDLGAVRPGAYADLLLLEDDPTVDISAAMNLRAVIKGGRQIDRQKLLERFKEALDN